MGPVFNGGFTELGVMSPFNGKNNCSSSTNGNGYKISVDQNGNNMLTNKDRKRFTITEIEVWQVSEISEKDAPSMINSLKNQY